MTCGLPVLWLATSPKLFNRRCLGQSEKPSLGRSHRQERRKLRLHAPIHVLVRAAHSCNNLVRGERGMTDHAIFRHAVAVRICKVVVSSLFA